MTRVYTSFFDPISWAKVNSESKELLEDFCLELQQLKRSKETIKQYRADLVGFLCYAYKTLDNRSILELTKKDFRNFSLYLVNDCGVSNARNNRLMSSIRSMLTYAEMDDELEYENNAARRVRGLAREPIKEIIFLSDQMVEGLFHQLVRREEYQKATLLMLAYDSAARRNELSQVTKYSFLDPARNNTNQVIGKGRKKFPLLYFGRTREISLAWLEQRRADDIESLWVIGEGENKRPADREYIYALFTDMRGQLTELHGHEVDFTPHCMRHSSLTNYGNGTHYICRQLGVGGFTLDQLRQIAHHNSIDTTRDYLPDTSNDELQKMFGILLQG
jgi:integrase